MDFVLPILKMGGAAAAVALLVLMGGRWPRALMPLALAAGFMAGYAMLHPFPQGTDERPWYLDESWKMAFAGVAVGGVLLAVARIVPRKVGLGVILLLAGAVTAAVVRTKWEGWGYYAQSLFVGLVCYIVAMMPVGKNERLWPVGPLVMWVCATAASVAIMAWVDTALGRMMMMVAVLAGVAFVLGLFRGMREQVTGAGPMLAVMFGVLLTLAANYNEGASGPILPRVVIGLLAFAPLGAGAAWVPALEGRPWRCAGAAVGVALLFLIPAMIVAAKYAPALVPEYEY